VVDGSVVVVVDGCVVVVDGSVVVVVDGCVVVVDGSVVVVVDGCVVVVDGSVVVVVDGSVVVVVEINPVAGASERTKFTLEPVTSEGRKTTAELGTIGFPSESAF
ncbi:MAG: hypothetical protein M0Z92_02870, partial [Actinomycetota bacterium]|nr:hypothetical protein [Actinomycetota bacterium]